jgi:hypothetical protein
MYDIAMNAVAMGSKGVAMSVMFLVILVALLGAGLFYFAQARQRNSPKPGDSGGPGQGNGGTGRQA